MKSNKKTIEEIYAQYPKNERIKKSDRKCSACHHNRILNNKSFSNPQWREKCAKCGRVLK